MIIHSDKIQDLEYEWDGYKSIKVFNSRHNIHKLEKFYKKEFNLQNQLNEEGKLELYFPSIDNAEKSILIADVKNEEAIEALQMYVGSDVLENIIQETKSGVVGVYFEHENKS